MELNLLALHFLDISWILIALAFGLLVTYISLPPMVGYLVAGFILSAIGIQSGDSLKAVADIGVTLLLFSIGFKSCSMMQFLTVRSRVRNSARPPLINIGESLFKVLNRVFFSY